MNDVTPQEWLTELRTTDRPQGTGAMRTTKGFCCLGVLADMVCPNAWNEVGPPTFFTFGPDRQVNSFGSLRPDWLTSPIRNEAITHNDARGLTFPEIADQLEQEFPATFGGDQ